MTTIGYSRRAENNETPRVQNITMETQFEMELVHHSIKKEEQSQFMSSDSVFDDDQAAYEEKDFAPEAFYELDFQDVGLADLSTKSTSRVTEQ